MKHGPCMITACSGTSSWPPDINNDYKWSWMFCKYKLVEEEDEDTPGATLLNCQMAVQLAS